MVTSIKYDNEDSGPVIIWCTCDFDENNSDETVEKIKEQLKEYHYSLITLKVDDWFKDYSIWKSDELDKKFSGQAERTLEWIEENVLPQFETSTRDIYVMGYSLAGLFALWCLTKKSTFAGAISCSGSLWYPGFLEYLRHSNPPIEKKNIYLSVGGKEANTKDSLMATVIDCTKEAKKILEKSNNVKLEINAGGHFTDLEKRLIKGMHWILQAPIVL